MPIFTLVATAILAETIFAGSMIATGLLAAGLGLVASIGLNYALKALSGTPAAADTAHFSAQGTLQAGGDIPRSFNFGYSSTAGSLVYANTWGSAALGGGADTPNAYLTQVIALQDLPGGTLSEVWINGELCTLGGTAETQYGMGFPVTQYYKNSTNHLWIKYYDGTQVTADAFLTAHVGSAAHPYPSTRVGVGVAYVICTSLVDDTLFTGFPTFKFALSGIPLYDPSKDSTVGGSGSHLYGTPSTWGGDGDNLPAVQIYNLLRGMYYGGKWFYGLQNMTAPRLPAANWIAQINKCRATVTGVSGPEATYRSGAQINVAAPLADAVEAILTACAGRVSETGGFYKIHLGLPDSPSFSFTDDNILSTEEQHFTPFFPLANSVNGIAAKYPSPAEGWNTKVAPPYYRTDLELLDGNRRLTASPAFDFVPYDGQVQRLMQSAILEAQRARRHTLVLPAEYWIVEPGDIGQWTSVRNGYSNKQFRVDGITDKGNLDVIITITEVDPSDYSWNQATDFTAVTIGPTIFARPIAQAIGSFTAVGVIIYDINGISRRPAIQLSWDGTQLGVAAVQYEVRLQSSGVIVSRGRTDQYAVGALIITESLLPNQIYEVRAAYIPTAPRDVTWSSWIAVTSPDVLYSLVEFDAAVTAQVTTVQDYLNDKLAAVEQLIASIASNNMAVDWLNVQTVRTEVSNAMGRVNSSVVNVQSASVAADAAMASDITTISASVASNTAGIAANTASIITNASAISTLNSSFASYQITVSSTFATQTALASTNANISTNYVTNSSLAGSLATLTTTISSTYATQTALASTNANISTNYVTNASLAGSLASYTTIVSASATYATQTALGTTNSNLTTVSASVTTNSSAIATLNGYAAARYSVTLDVNGYGTGFVLLNGGGGVSSFTITTTKFQIAAPGVGGGAAVPIFTVANVAGAAKVALRADMIVDGSIIAQNIAAGTITASQIASGTITSSSGVIGNLSVNSISIADNAVTVAQYGTCGAFNGNAAYQTVISVPVSINTAGLAGKTISALLTFSGAQSTTGGTMWGAKVGANGTSIAATQVSGANAATADSFSTSGVYTFTASGGTDTFTAEAYWYGIASTNHLTQGILTVTSVKR